MHSFPDDFHSCSRTPLGQQEVRFPFPTHSELQLFNIAFALKTAYSITILLHGNLQRVVYIFY
jgi:hypothetical protein